jgi:hypothetical protein
VALGFEDVADAEVDEGGGEWLLNAAYILVFHPF